MAATAVVVVVVAIVVFIVVCFLPLLLLKELLSPSTDEMIAVGGCVGRSMVALRHSMEALLVAHVIDAACGPGGEYGLAELRGRKALLHWPVKEVRACVRLCVA